MLETQAGNPEWYCLEPGMQCAAICGIRFTSFLKLHHSGILSPIGLWDSLVAAKNK